MCYVIIKILFLIIIFFNLDFFFLFYIYIKRSIGLSLNIWVLYRLICKIICIVNWVLRCNLWLRISIWYLSIIMRILIRVICVWCCIDLSCWMVWSLFYKIWSILILWGRNRIFCWICMIFLILCLVIRGILIMW